MLGDCADGSGDSYILRKSEVILARYRIESSRFRVFLTKYQLTTWVAAIAEATISWYFDADALLESWVMLNSSMR